MLHGLESSAHATPAYSIQPQIDDLSTSNVDACTPALGSSFLYGSEPTAKLASQVGRHVAASFAEVTINFQPRVQEMEAQGMQCEADMAVCNRECERLFGERQVELEEPCKL